MATKRDSSYKKTPQSDININSQELINNNAANNEMSFNIKLSAEHKPNNISSRNNSSYNNQMSFEPLPESNYENSINSANPVKDEIKQENQGFKINKMFDEQVEMVIQNVTQNVTSHNKGDDRSVAGNEVVNENIGQNLKIN